MALTKAQRAVLEEAKRNGGRVSLTNVTRKGGSKRRMLERMRERRLIEGPPWQITGLGEDALTEANGSCG